MGVFFRLDIDYIMKNISIVLTHHSTRNAAVSSWVRYIKQKNNVCIYINYDTETHRAYAYKVLSDDIQEKVALDEETHSYSKEQVVELIQGTLSAIDGWIIDEVYCEGNLTVMAGTSRCQDAHYFIDSFLPKKLYVFSETDDCTNDWRNFFDEKRLNKKISYAFSGDQRSVSQKRKEFELAEKTDTNITRTASPLELGELNQPAPLNLKQPGGQSPYRTSQAHQTPNPLIFFSSARAFLLSFFSTNVAPSHASNPRKVHPGLDNPTLTSSHNTQST